jgi:hypothetical protein
MESIFGENLCESAIELRGKPNFSRQPPSASENSTYSRKCYLTETQKRSTDVHVRIRHIIDLPTLVQTSAI